MSVKDKGTLRGKSLLETVRPVLCMVRVAGLGPLSCEPDVNKGYCVKLSRHILIYCCVAGLCFYGIIVTSIVYLYKCGILDVHNFYLHCTRVPLAIICHYSTFYKHLELANVLNSQESSQVVLPLYYTIVPMVVYIGTVIHVTLNEIKLKPTVITILLGGMIGLVPSIELECIYALYISQIAVIYRTILNLNDNLAKCVALMRTSKSVCLRHIMKEHLAIREICDKLNNTYGVPMLMSMSEVCLEVTWCFYCVCVLDDGLSITLCITWCSLYLLSAFTVMGFCQRAESAMRATRAISNDMTSMTFQLSTDVRDQLREWEVQLKQLPIQFTAKGLLNLDGGQIKAVVSTIISYTVIFLQTLCPESSSNGKST